MTVEAPRPGPDLKSQKTPSEGTIEITDPKKKTGRIFLGGKWINYKELPKARPPGSEKKPNSAQPRKRYNG